MSYLTLFFTAHHAHIQCMRFILLTLMFVCAFAGSARAGLTVIRDTEIETTLRSWMTPIWRAAGLNPDAVKLILVSSDDFNAFVAGGSNIFVYTGMLAQTKNPGEILGVLAHETGHIAGGHLIRGRAAMERASYEALLGTILGVAVGVAGGGKAAGGIMMGGQGLGMASFLAHSRVQESSADQAGLRFMQGAGYSPQGMVTLLESMKAQEYRPQGQQTAYLQTHPMTADRLTAMEAGAAKSPFKDKPYPAEWNDAYARIKAKLLGFTSPERVAWVYSDKDTSTPALYAKTIAAYRQSRKEQAVSLADQLIAREPNNPYFHEIKGQMLRDFSDITGAAASYRKAVSLKPDAALIRIDLAQVLVEMAQTQKKPALYREAEDNLDAAYQREQRSSEIQRLYATIYGREGDQPRAQYHLAEQSMLQGRHREATKLLTGALAGMTPGSPDYRKAQDLKVYLDSLPKKDKDEDDERENKRR